MGSVIAVAVGSSGLSTLVCAEFVCVQFALSCIALVGVASGLAMGVLGGRLLFVDQHIWVCY